MKFALALMLAAATLTAAPAHAHEVSKNTAVFFEIPVSEFDRAVAFYENIFAVKLDIKRMDDFVMAFFPMKEGEHDVAGGALIKSNGAVPGSNGPIVYLNGGADLAVVLARVEGAGGKVVHPKTLISPEVGYFALFLDTEGNRLGLFSGK